jgi:hypothetical protein
MRHKISSSAEVLSQNEAVNAEAADSEPMRTPVASGHEQKKTRNPVSVSNARQEFGAGLSFPTPWQT